MEAPADALRIRLAATAASAVQAAAVKTAADALSAATSARPHLQFNIQKHFTNPNHCLLSSASKIKAPSIPWLPTTRYTISSSQLQVATTSTLQYLDKRQFLRCPKRYQARSNPMRIHALPSIRKNSHRLSPSSAWTLRIQRVAPQTALALCSSSAA